MKSIRSTRMLQVECAGIEFDVALELSQLIILPLRADLLVCNRGYQISRYIRYVTLRFASERERERAQGFTGIYGGLVTRLLFPALRLAYHERPTLPLPSSLSPPPKLSTVSESCIAIFCQP